MYIYIYTILNVYINIYLYIYKKNIIDIDGPSQNAAYRCKHKMNGSNRWIHAREFQSRSNSRQEKPCILQCSAPLVPFLFVKNH